MKAIELLLLWWKESTTFVVADGQTEETVVSGPPSVVELAAAEPTGEVSGIIAHTQFATSFQFTVTAGSVDAENSPSSVQVLSTEWVVDPTTIELTFSETISYVQLTESTSIEITIPTEHTHLTVNGVETAIDLPGLTTTVIAEESTDIYLRIPATTTSLVFDGTTITLLAETITMSDDKCGDGNSDTLYYTVKSGEVTTCYVATQIDTAVSASILYLTVPNTVGTYTLAGIATTFVPKQTITIVNDCSCRSVSAKIELPTIISTFNAISWIGFFIVNTLHVRCEPYILWLHSDP